MCQERLGFDGDQQAQLDDPLKRRHKTRRKRFLLLANQVLDRVGVTFGSLFQAPNVFVWNVVCVPFGSGATLCAILSPIRKTKQGDADLSQNGYVLFAARRHLLLLRLCFAFPTPRLAGRIVMSSKGNSYDKFHMFEV